MFIRGKNMKGLDPSYLVLRYRLMADFIGNFRFLIWLRAIFKTVYLLYSNAFAFNRFFIMLFKGYFIVKLFKGFRLNFEELFAA